MENFETCLSSPYGWRPVKICKVFNDLHNLKTHLSKNSDIVAFCERLESAANEHKILGPTGNWMDALGDKHFELVTQTDKKIKAPKWWGTSVLSLLRVIRNKQEHCDEFTDEERVDLGWFERKNGKYEFDHKLFATYWIRKFPNLVVFLWSQFGSFRGSCRQYYPDSLEYDDVETLNFGVADFVRQLRLACCHQLDHGYLEDRFQCVAISCSIELRTLSEDLLGRVLDGDSIVELVVTPAKMEILWNGNQANFMEYELMSPLNESECEKDGVGFINTYIFTSGSDKVDEIAILNQVSSITSSKNKIVIFTTKDAVNGIVAKFANDLARFKRDPISWWDVSELKRKEIECSNDFVVKIQSEKMPFKELLPGDKRIREEVLTKLEGQALNELLRSKSLSVLKKYEIPEVDKHYTERRFYNLEELHNTVFKKPSESDVFIVLKKASERNPLVPVKMVETRLDTIFPKFLITSQLNIVTVKDSETKFLEESLETFKDWREDNLKKNVHFFRYLDGGIFKWVTTYGSLSSVQSQFIEAAKKAKIMKEPEFLKSLRSKNSKKRLILIADQPGMGKSQMLTSLAGKMTGNAGNKKIVMFFNMPQFVQTVRKNSDEHNENAGESLKAIVLKTITELTCSENYEKALVANLLSESGSEIRFEIMLDGLDEVTHELLVEATKILQVFLSNLELPVRVWVTLRDHMLDYIKTTFKTLGYKLDPLSQSEQIGLMTDMWSRKWENKSKCLDLSKNLQKFARKCIENCLSSGNADLAGIPLQCRIIAEIYEDQVVNQKFNRKKVKCLDLNDLYGKLMDRKLEVYLREKKMIPESVTNDDPLVQNIYHSLNPYLEFLSVKLIFSEEIADTLQSFLSVPTDPERIKGLNAMVLEHGIVQDISQLKFIHRTIAEYLVARFVANFLRHFLRDHDDLDDLPPVFQDFLWKHVLADKYTVGHYAFTNPTLCYFLDTFLKTTVMDITSSQTTGKRSNFLESQIFMEFISKSRFTVYTRGFLFDSVFYAAAGNVLFGMPLLKHIIWITAQSMTRLSRFFVFTLLIEELQLAKYVIENMDFGPEHWHLVKNIDERKLGVLHYFLCASNRLCRNATLDEVKNFVKYLVAIQPNLLKERSASGKTPLLLFVNSLLPFVHHGWKQRSEDILNFLAYLVSLGVDIHDVDKNNNTVLHLGAPQDISDFPMKPLVEYYLINIFITRNYFHVCKFFLENGCDGRELNCFNSKGHTPLITPLNVFEGCLSDLNEISRINNVENEDLQKTMIDLLNLFRDHGMDLNLKDSSGQTVFYKAIEADFSLFVLKKLVEYGANILNPCGNGKTAFQLAVEMGNNELARYLLKYAQLVCTPGMRAGSSCLAVFHE